MAPGQNLVVVRYKDGRLLKGTTFDFVPNKDRFHVQASDASGGPSVLVMLADLKAVFFVKDLIGNPEYVEKKNFNEYHQGIKIRVLFKDGEELVGTAAGYRAERQGFFMFPADSASNNDRVFVVASATERVWLRDEAEKGSR